MIIIEAFARKTPAVVRNLGALPEVVSASNGGFIYHTDEELLGFLRQLAGSPQLRAELGENGYRAFLRFWSREAHMNSYFDQLRKIALRKYAVVPWEEEPLATQRLDEEVRPNSLVGAVNHA